METPAEAAATDPSARSTFSQVVFIDIPHSYPPATRVTCRYTLTAAFQSNPRDWVGIFKVGWSTTKDYHTFVWVEPGPDEGGQQPLTRQAVFEDYYLPKDEIEFYQFCYIDSNGQVRGASTPFCFRTSEDQSIGSNPDYDLLVVTTQDQVEQSGREKAELQIKLDRIMEENETLKSVLQKEQHQSASLKVQNEQKDKEKSQLVEELDQMKGQSENLRSALQQQLKETERLQEASTAMAKQMETRERNAAEQKQASLAGASRHKETHKPEKYERAVVKINQLKEEREELRARVDAQSEEITTLNSKVREDERELFKMKDSIQLLQFDLQSSKKEKQMLSSELQRLQIHADTAVKELRGGAAQQETQQNCPDDDLKVECQTLARQLQDAQAKLAAAREESKSTKRRAELLEGDLLEIRKELKHVMSSYEEAKQKSGKQEQQLREAHEAIADNVSVIEEKDRVIVLKSRKNEELAREKQNLASNIEELRGVNADLIAANSANSPYEPDAAGTAAADQGWQLLETPEQPAGLYENTSGLTDPEEESLVCRHCQERFPLITPEELEQHEQSHRLCPICMMTCDNMEQPVFEDHVYSHEL